MFGMSTRYKDTITIQQRIKHFFFYIYECQLIRVTLSQTTLANRTEASRRRRFPVDSGLLPPTGHKHRILKWSVATTQYNNDVASKQAINQLGGA